MENKYLYPFVSLQVMFENGLFLQSLIRLFVSHSYFIIGVTHLDLPYSIQTYILRSSIHPHTGSTSTATHNVPPRQQHHFGEVPLPVPDNNVRHHHHHQSPTPFPPHHTKRDPTRSPNPRSRISHWCVSAVQAD